MKMENGEKCKVLKLCTEFLAGAWSQVNLENIFCEQLYSGVANHTYRCSIKECKNLSKYEETEYKEVIVRVHGSDLFEPKDAFKFIEETGEALTIHVLSQYGLAPKLLGVFNGGVIVEYIPSRVSTTDDWKDKKKCVVFARKLALLHTMSIAIEKRPLLLEKVEKIARLLNGKKVDLSQLSPRKRVQAETIIDFPFQDEYNWIQSLVDKVGYKVVFSHNELNPNNILLKHQFSSLYDRIIFIDFEQCTHYYRGYDLAQFLKKKDMKYGKVGDEISAYFEATNSDVREVILKEYLSESKRLKPKEFNEKFDTFDRLSMEVDFFGMVFTLFVVGVYRHMIAIEPNIRFPFDMGITLVTEYAPHKLAFLQKYTESV